MWMDPDTVGGGVSIENTSGRSAERSKRYVPSDSQRCAHPASMPSSVGLSGIRPIGPGYGTAGMHPRGNVVVPLALVDVLRLYDTATREVRELALRDPGRVSIYLCGPTVYAPPHLGHGRQNVVYDVLVRYLRWTGLDVRLVSNITDIDDQIINRANAESRPWQDI